MRKRVVSIGYIFLLSVCLAVTLAIRTKAAEELPVIDNSYLTQEAESDGEVLGSARGKDLMTGYSKVRNLGEGILYAGGSTIAAHIVGKVGVAVIVERAQEGDAVWTFYDGWQSFSENTDRISSNRRMPVESGYYYRVRCIHSANDDVSSSFTNGVYME